MPTSCAIGLTASLKRLNASSGLEYIEDEEAVLAMCGCMYQEALER
jgi:hypothetical protein